MGIIEGVIDGVRERVGNGVIERVHYWIKLIGLTSLKDLYVNKRTCANHSSQFTLREELNIMNI